MCCIHILSRFFFSLTRETEWQYSFLYLRPVCTLEARRHHHHNTYMHTTYERGYCLAQSISVSQLITRVRVEPFFLSLPSAIIITTL